MRTVSLLTIIENAYKNNLYWFSFKDNYLDAYLFLQPNL